MSKGDATIKVEFQASGAAATNAVVRSVYQNQQAMMKATARQNNMLGTSIRKVGRSMLFGVAGYAGVTGISTVMSSVNQGMEEFISKRRELEDAITPLASLGDNVMDLQGLRNEVTGTAISMGRPIKEVSDMMFDLKSTTGNLTTDIREGLKKETLSLAKITGGDLVTAQNLMTKSYQIAGKEVKNLTELSNKLMFTQDQAAVTFNELAQRAPEVLAAGQVVGVTFNEVMASIIGATKKSGSIEKTFTGMRNVFLLMEQAQEKGITLTGSYTDKLAQLRREFSTNSTEMQKLFGQESVVAAKVLADSVDDVNASLRTMKSITGESSTAMEKLAQKFKDPVFAQTQRQKAIDDTFANATNLYIADGGDLGNMGRTKRNFDYGATHWKRSGLWGGDFGANIIGGTLGAVFPSFADLGREQVMENADENTFISLQREKFEEKKRRDIESAKFRQRLLFTPAAFYTRPYAISRDLEEAENRQMPTHLQLSGEGIARGGGAAEEVSKNTEVLKRIEAKLEAFGYEFSGRTVMGFPVPDRKSGKTNAEETL